MADGLFEREEALLDAAQSYLDAGHFKNPDAKKEFAAFVKAYGGMLKQYRRLVRISDRTSAELNNVAKALDEKNAMLEGLSSKLSKYLSPQVYDSIFRGDRDVAIATERKKLTVFFSDIKDFTATTEGMEPEDLTDLLNLYLTEMSVIALKHGATIDKYIGDAMLMFFGDPETKGVKEDAQTCVRMAVEMQARMAELQEIWHDQGYEHPFKMRIGINTGYCNVGNFGSDVRMDYTIIGGEVNLAARLEGIAEPGGTC
jgi:adenylate cyclase